jgi:hypothetical protein
MKRQSKNLRTAATVRVTDWLDHESDKANVKDNRKFEQKLSNPAMIIYQHDTSLKARLN